MKLRAKIFPHYFDAITQGNKQNEFRQFESIILDDGHQSAEFEITEVIVINGKRNAAAIQLLHPDVSFDPKKQIVSLKLGRQIGKTWLT